MHKINKKVSVIDIKKVPSSLYAKVYKVKDIINYQLMDKRTLMSMAHSIEGYDLMKDVAILRGNNIYKTITRNELTGTYTKMNGKPIKILGLHYNTTYVAVKPTKELYRIIKIPKNARYTISINGKPLPRGSITLFGADGKPIQVLKTELDIRLFRAQYIIEELPNIKQAKGKIYEVKQVKKIQAERTAVANQKSWSPAVKPKEVDELTKAPYAVISRITRLNPKTGKRVLVGFIVRDLRKNNQINSKLDKKSDEPKTVQVIHHMCVEKQIRNLTVAFMEETNKTYFRGVGIKIENLPEFPAEKLGR